MTYVWELYTELFLSTVWTITSNIFVNPTGSRRLVRFGGTGAQIKKALAVHILH